MVRTEAPVLSESRRSTATPHTCCHRAFPRLYRSPEIRGTCGSVSFAPCSWGKKRHKMRPTLPSLFLLGLYALELCGCSSAGTPQPALDQPQRNPPNFPAPTKPNLINPTWVTSVDAESLAMIDPSLRGVGSTVNGSDKSTAITNGAISTRPQNDIDHAPDKMQVALIPKVAPQQLVGTPRDVLRQKESRPSPVAGEVVIPRQEAIDSHRNQAPKSEVLAQPVTAKSNGLTSDDMMKEMQRTASVMIVASKEDYRKFHGMCACPDDHNLSGERCGDQSGYHGPAFRKPLCYIADVTPDMIVEFRRTGSILFAGR